MFWDRKYTKSFGEKMYRQKPDAAAVIQGSPKYPNIRGIVSFYQTARGVLVAAEVYHLPHEAGKCRWRVYGCHIHEGRSCSGSAEDPFANAGGHYNPDNCKHPEHAGDLPPLFGNAGYAWNAVLTDRFTVNEVLGRTVIIHGSPDDFVSQPAGNSGEKIACGMIERG